MARLLLLSTYELGEQPLGLAVPARWLGDAGHSLVAADLAVEGWPAQAVADADAIVCSVPMHTALRLAAQAIERVRAARADLPVALIGLYAPVAAALALLGPGDLATTGADPDELLRWADALGGCPNHRLGRPSSLPRRDLLPSLESYARLEQDGVELLVGAVESTTGCNHRCRHCPVPLVHHGRSHAVSLDVVLEDVGQLVDLGAGHIHFADPDFLNRPQHARRVAQAIASEHPGLSFDITAKVSHLLRHEALLPELAEAGLAFVISAFESTSDLVLERLDKGHVAADLPRAVLALRRAGIEPRPSLLPFTPWTERDDLVSLFDFVLAYDLVWNVDPVQYSIRLLLPPASPLVEDADDETRAALRGYDAAELGYRWAHRDPLLDDLQRELSAIAERDAARSRAAEETFEELRATTLRRLGRADERPLRASTGRGAGPSRPRLSEAWFCCAEPTGTQLGRILAAPDEADAPPEAAAVSMRPRSLRTT